MATSKEKNIVERLAGAGEEVLERIASIAAAERMVGTLGTLKERVDDLQKSVRTIDRLERRLSAIEWRLTKLEGKTSTKSRKASSGSRKRTATRKTSAGMSGAIAQRANDTTKALGGKVSYVWATFAVFARWSNSEVDVSVGAEKRRARMHDVVVANGPYFGGGMKICPDAALDDGAFDVLLIGDLTKRDLLFTMPKIFRGTHLPHPKAELLRGAEVLVESGEPLPIQLDGEQPSTTPARFEAVPRALRVRVPG